MTYRHFGKRLRAARIAAGYKTSLAFVTEHKISASTYSQYERGRRKPDPKTVQRLAELLQTDPEWLATGLSELPQTDKKNGKEIPVNSVSEKLLVEIFNQVLHLVESSRITNLPIKKISAIAAGIYKDITTHYHSEKEQLKSVTLVVDTYKRLIVSLPDEK